MYNSAYLNPLLCIMPSTPKQQYEHNKLNKRLRHQVGAAINDFNID